MDFKELILRSVKITWTHKWLWVFGFFAGGASVMPNGGNSFTWQEPGSFDNLNYEIRGWINQNWEIIVAFLVFLVFLAVVFAALSIISQGALISAAAALDEEAETSFGGAFNVGLGAFWSLAGLFVLIMLIIVTPIVILAIPVVLALATGNIILMIVLGVFALLLILALIPVMVVVGIVTTFGTRNVVLQKQGARAALRSGWKLFRANAGQSIIIWLVSLVLTIAFSFMFFIVALVLMVPVAIVGYFVYEAGFNLVNIGIIAFLGLALLSLMVAVVSGFRAFTSVYWTLAYRELSAVDKAADDDVNGGSTPEGAAPAGA